MAKKTYNEKLNHSGNLPRTEEISVEAGLRYGGTKMFIAEPLAYDKIMKQIPQGKLITVDLIRKHLAKLNDADFTCPLTAGIFVNIAANASIERNGKDETPYWRTLKKDGELNEKYPFGIEGQKSLLVAEGHTVVQKGKRYFVAKYEEKLYLLN